MERVSIDLHVTADGHVSWGDEGTALIDVLVLSLVQELALNDSTVLLGGLIDANVVIGQVEGDDESTVDILRHASVELGGEAEDLLVVVHGLEEVNLGLLWDELVHLSEGVLLVTETVIGWSDWLHGLSWLLELHLAERELVAILLSVVLLGEGVDTADHVDAAVGVDVGGWGDLVASQVVVTDEVLAWLVDIETVWELLSAEEHGESISSVIGVVALTDLEGVIGEIVVDDVGEIVLGGEETEDATIVVQELLLGLDFAATEALLHEVSHLGVVDARLGDLRLLEVVFGGSRCRWQGSSLTLHNYKAFES